MATDGPLLGVRVIEVGGMGPTPFAGMTLADMGAEVIRIDRPGGLGVFPGEDIVDVLNRGKRSVGLDLKQPEAIHALLAGVEKADILIEGHRPGVAERLGFGPDDCWLRNPALVYGRMTGWGQDGPRSMTAGHDISYIAVTGALGAIGEAQGPPRIPINLVGDFGGGGIYLVTGVLAALHEATRTGRGQVVDAAIVDGAAHLLAGAHAMLNTGTWRDERGVNALDGGAPFYNVYETSDGKYMAVGAIESKFYTALITTLGLPLDPRDQHDRSKWPAIASALQTAFRRRSQAEWREIFLTSDACVSPVLSLREAADDPQVHARGSVTTDADGFIQPGTAPRFSAHASAVGPRPPQAGQHTRDTLADWGVDPEPLIASGAAFDNRVRERA